MEQFEFPFAVVYPPELDKGDLRCKFAGRILVDGALGGGGRGPMGGGDAPPPDISVLDEAGLPAEYRGRRGSITTAKTLPQLKKFLENGGTILTIGSSTALAKQLGLPIANHLVTKDADGKEKPLGREKFYVPPSILRVKLDTNHPLAWGLQDEVDVMFANSRRSVCRTSRKSSLSRVAWFASKTAPKRLGLRARTSRRRRRRRRCESGRGRLVLYGPQVLPPQPHGTFKLVLNAIMRGGEGIGGCVRHNRSRIMQSSASMTASSPPCSSIATAL